MNRLAYTALALVGLFPSSQAEPRVDDKTVEARINSILAKMTLEEKIDMLAGASMMNTKGLSRLGLPSLTMSDGPVGAHNPNPSTAYAAGIGLAATWDTDLAQRIGVQIGRDARSRGAHFLLGPGVNIYRSPYNGRNFEYFGEDPFLASRVSTGYILGVQSQEVSATIKHFTANNSEFARNTSNSVIDERTLREIYLPMYEDAVKRANVGAIMTSYNLVNGSHMSQNAWLNNVVAKQQWGFKGLIMSDWFGTHNGIPAANGGLDLEMPFPMNMNRQNLLPAVKAGTVTLSTIDDKVRRILRLSTRMGWLDRPQLDTSIPRYNQAGRAVTLEAAQKSAVLLKNAHNLLPFDLKKIKTIAVIGPTAYPAIPTAGGSGQVAPYTSVSLLTGLSDALGTKVKVTYAKGLPSLAQMSNVTTFTTEPKGTVKGLTVETFENETASGSPVATRVERRVNFGKPGFNPGGDSEESFPDDGPGFGGRPKPTSTRWTGYFDWPGGTANIFVQSSATFRLLVDDRVWMDASAFVPFSVNQRPMKIARGNHKVVVEFLRGGMFGSFGRMGVLPIGKLVTEEAKSLAKSADAVVLAVGYDAQIETEGVDRDFNLPPGQDELVHTIADLNKKSVVILNAGGAVSVARWLPNVGALVQGWYGGQEGGTAIAGILTGKVNPSGRLPISWERSQADNPSAQSYYFTRPDSQDIQYREGVFVGYRGYDQQRAKPLFPFGYGLSYTTFAYGPATAKRVQKGTGAGPHYAISFSVTNTGQRTGSDVAQIYVSSAKASVSRPKKELKAFARVELKPGQTKQVQVVLSGRAFTYFDVKQRKWMAPKGNYGILVGRSSSEIVQKASVKLEKAFSLTVQQ